MDDWECSCGPYHIFDEEEISICVECDKVHFYCLNCQKEIAQKAVNECSKQTRYLVLQLIEVLSEGEGA